VTVYDISKIYAQSIEENPKRLPEIKADIKTVLGLGSQIKKLEEEVGWVSAKKQHERVK
jgi:hypothetical protein